MKKLKRFLTGLLLAPLIWHAATGQTLDPTFSPSAIYAPGTVYSVVEQPDGKRVATGVFRRVNGTEAFNLSRFNADGSLDAGFQQNVGAASAIYRIKLVPNSQLILSRLPR